MIPDDMRTITTASKDVLRKFIPDFLLKRRSIVLRLGPRAGRIYATLRLRNALRVRASNRRLVPPSARSFLFVCFGNIMRSAMAEFLMRQAFSEGGAGRASPDHVRRSARQRRTRSPSLGTRGVRGSGNFAG